MHAVCLVVHCDLGIQLGLGVEEGEQLQAGGRLRPAAHKRGDACKIQHVHRSIFASPEIISADITGERGGEEERKINTKCKKKKYLTGHTVKVREYLLRQIKIEFSE